MHQCAGLLLFGAGVAPTAANYVYDVTASYDLVLIGLIPLFLLTAQVPELQQT